MQFMYFLVFFLPSKHYYAMHMIPYMVKKQDIQDGYIDRELNQGLIISTARNLQATCLTTFVSASLLTILERISLEKNIIYYELSTDCNHIYTIVICSKYNEIYILLCFEQITII